MDDEKRPERKPVEDLTYWEMEEAMKKALKPYFNDTDKTS